MRRVLVLTLVVVVVTLVAAGSAGGIAYWAMARRFVAGDAHALDGIVRAPVNEPLVLRNVSLWDGRGGPVQPGRSVVVNDGRIVGILETAVPSPAGVRTIDASGKTLIPGLIDAHVHLMYDSGPYLLTRAPQLMDEWLAITRRYPESRAPIVRRGQLKLKAGITTMRVLGDGYYSLAYRDDLARWDVVGPRVLTAGLHVNGPKGYVSGGLGAHLDGAARAEVAVELRSGDEIERRLEDHIARGVDVIKIATTHGDLGFQDAKPDLPEAWVREIVRVAHEHGLKVTAHSYGTEGDWAAVRGGVDGIEHLVNVPHELSDDLVQAIKARGIYVCPTLSGSAYSVWKFLQAPELLYQDPDLVANVTAGVRKNLYFTIRVLRLPGVARLLLRQPEPMRQWERWYQQSLQNTEKLYRAGVPLIFGTDTPFVFGNFFHSVMNEVRALKLAGLPNEAILRMATSNAATALGINDRVGTIEPGKRADLVLLDGDPVSDIEALGHVELVMKEGRIVYRRDPNASSSSAIRGDTREVRVLRAAFLAGAVTDAGALLPMLLPSLATRLWGLRDVSGSYQLAMGCAASLMLGWTLLLVWASRRPLERRVVAPLTFLVVGGIVVTEIVGAVAGVVDAWRLVPTWCLQVILLILFAWAYHAGRQASRAPQVMP